MHDKPAESLFCASKIPTPTGQARNQFKESSRASNGWGLITMKDRTFRQILSKITLPPRKNCWQKGAAYKCFCTKEELDAKREAALAAKKPLGYDRTCRNLSADEIAEKEGQVSLLLSVSKCLIVLVLLAMMTKSSAVSSPTIPKLMILSSSGQTAKPLYLLCNVVDDIRDRITHIIRGQDHMTNTLKQVLLYEALDAPLPVFAHMPLTLDTKKAKISKRSHGEIVAVQFYRDSGFIPWAFNNFLALLGWSAGNDQEFFEKEELIKKFSLERINKSSAIFNYQKNDPKFFTDPKAIYINEHYLRTMEIAELGEMVRKELELAGLWQEAYAAEQKDWYLGPLI